MRKIISLLLVGLLTACLVSVNSANVYGDVRHHTLTVQGDFASTQDPETIESESGYTIYNYTISSSGHNACDYGLNVSESGILFNGNCTSGINDSSFRINANETQSYCVCSSGINPEQYILLEKINITYHDSIWDNSPITDVELNTDGLIGSADLNFNYNNDTYHYTVSVNHEAFVANNSYRVSFTKDGHSQEEIVNRDNPKVIVDSNCYIELEYCSESNFNYNLNNFKQSDFKLSNSESGVIEKTITVNSNKPDDSYQIQVSISNRSNSGLSFNNANDITDDTISLSGGNKTQTVCVYDLSQSGKKIEQYNFKLENIWDNSNITIKSSKYDIEYASCFYDESISGYKFEYKIIVPFDELNSMNSGVFIPLTIQEKDQAENPLDVSVINQETYVDEKGGTHSFEVVSDYENNIGISCNYEGWVEINKVEKVGEVYEYYMLVHSYHADGNANVEINRKDDSTPIDSINLDVNNNTDNPMVVELKDGETLIQKYYFSFVYDSWEDTKTANFKSFSSDDFTQECENDEIQKDGNDYIFNNGAKYNPIDKIIYVRSEDQLRFAIDKLTKYDGGHIVITEGFTIQNTLNINHLTSDSNSFGGEMKYTDENAKNFLLIELDDGVELKVKNAIHVLDNSKVSFVGKDKSSNAIKLSSGSGCKNIFINNGTLIVDKVAITSNIEDTYCINMGIGQLELGDVLVQGPRAIVNDVNSNEPSIYANGSTIIGTSDYAYGDLRVSNNNENGSISSFKNTIIEGATSAIVSNSFTALEFGSCSVSGKNSAVEIYKGEVKTNYFGDDSKSGASYFKSSNGPVFDVYTNKYNLDSIKFYFGDGFFDGGEYPVIQEISNQTTSSISDITVDTGVFVSTSNSGVFDTKCTNFEIKSSETNEDGGYFTQESAYYPNVKKYANVSFSNKITDDSVADPIYEYVKYTVQDSPRADSPTSNYQYAVKANRDITVNSESGLLSCLENSRYLVIDLDSDITNTSGENKIIEITRPITINLNGNRLSGYTIKVNDPSATDNQVQTHYINGFNLDENRVAGNNTISNSYGPVLVVDGSTSINGVSCISSYSGGYGIEVSGNTALYLNENSLYKGNKGIELIAEENKRPMLYVAGNTTEIEVDNGYGVYAHGEGSEYTSVSVQNGAKLVAKNDAALYTSTCFDISIFDAYIEGTTGLIAENVDYENGSVDTRLIGGTIKATGTPTDDKPYLGACYSLSGVNRYDFEVLKADFNSANNYCFYLKNSGTNEPKFRVWDGKFKSADGLEIINTPIDCVECFKGGTYSSEIYKAVQGDSFEKLIPDYYEWKQLKPLDDDYPYAIVHKLNNIDATGYTLNTYELIESLGNIQEPVVFEIDKGIFATSIDKDNIGKYSDSGQNVDLVFVVNGDATSEGQGKFEASNSGNGYENILYLDMHITSPSSSGKLDIHETDEYQHITIDISKSFEGIDIDTVVLQHYETVNGEKQIVTIPKVTPEFAANANSECFFIEDGNLVLVTNNFSDFELAKASEAIQEREYILPTGLYGFVGDELKTVKLPTNFKWVDGDTSISGGENSYQIMYDNRIIDHVKVNGVATSVIGENSVSGSASGLLDANDITKAQKQFIIDSLTKDDVVSEKVRFAVKNGDNVSLKVNINVADTSESGVAADIAKLKNSPTYGNQKIIGVYTIDVEVMINGSSFANVTELSKGIEFKFDIPTDLPEVANGFTRKFSMMTVHNNVLSELGSSVVGGKLKVNITGFSTFMLCYRDYANPVRRHNYVTTNTSVK